MVLDADVLRLWGFGFALPPSMLHRTRSPKESFWLGERENVRISET